MKGFMRASAKNRLFEKSRTQTGQRFRLDLENLRGHNLRF